MYGLRSKSLAALTALALFGCGKAEEAPGGVVESKQDRLVASAPAANLSKAVAGNTDFALSLYSAISAKGTGGNLFFSSQSVTTALAMTYAGAAGTTKTAFENTMKIGLDSAAYHRALNDLDYQLTHRGENVKTEDGEVAFKLSTTNQLFAQKGFDLKAPFLDTIAMEYGANVRLMSFDEQPEPSRTAINTWVASRTEQRIQELLTAGSIDPSTRLVLVNAIYFKADWKQKFEASATKDEVFHAPDGDVTVPTMNEFAAKVRAATVDGTEVVELPYVGDELSMLILAPAQGTLAAYESSLTRTKLDESVAALKNDALTLSLPKFEIQQPVMMGEILKELGLAPAFSNADFSNMTSASVELSDVVHQAFVKVDEKGTEAAAATAVVIRETSAPLTRTVKIDRPFLFLVRDNATGAVVFMGRVTKP